MENKHNYLAKMMTEALQDQRFVNIKICSAEGDQLLTGWITKIDQITRRIKISHDEGIDWIPLDDIVDVKLIV